MDVPSWTWTLTALAGALAMDATAAAACHGLGAKRARVRTGVTLAITFGIFQSAMTLAGWGLGALAGPWIEAWDHWIAFALLSALGAKMMHEAWPARQRKVWPWVLAFSAAMILAGMLLGVIVWVVLTIT